MREEGLRVEEVWLWTSETRLCTRGGALNRDQSSCL